MDKILSARVDEAVLLRIGALAKRLRTSKKRVIEEAVKKYAEEIEQPKTSGVFEQTAGAWGNRKESPEEIIEQIRKEFQDSMERHHK